VNEANFAGPDDEVMIGSGDINATVLETIPILRMDRGKPSGARQNLGKHAADLCKVQHDKDGGAQVARQVRDESADGFNAPSRGADDNDIVSGHGGIRASSVPHSARLSSNLQADNSALTV
jgi:hypothetical protein